MPPTDSAGGRSRQVKSCTGLPSLGWLQSGSRRRRLILIAAAGEDAGNPSAIIPPRTLDCSISSLQFTTFTVEHGPQTRRPVPAPSRYCPRNASLLLNVIDTGSLLPFPRVRFPSYFSRAGRPRTTTNIMLHTYSSLFTPLCITTASPLYGSRIVRSSRARYQLCSLDVYVDGGKQQPLLEDSDGHDHPLGARIPRRHQKETGPYPIPPCH